MRRLPRSAELRRKVAKLEGALAADGAVCRCGVEPPARAIAVVTPEHVDTVCPACLLERILIVISPELAEVFGA